MVKMDDYEGDKNNDPIFYFFSQHCTTEEKKSMFIWNFFYDGLQLLLQTLTLQPHFFWAFKEYSSTIWLSLYVDRKSHILLYGNIQIYSAKDFKEGESHAIRNHGEVNLGSLH